MTRLPATDARCPSSPRALRTAGMAGLVIALGLSLSGCQSDTRALTPAGQALIASQPTVAATNVPPPPAIVGIVSAPAPSAASDTPQTNKKQKHFKMFAPEVYTKPDIFERSITDVTHCFCNSF